MFFYLSYDLCQNYLLLNAMQPLTWAPEKAFGKTAVLKLCSKLLSDTSVPTAQLF